MTDYGSQHWMLDINLEKSKDKNLEHYSLSFDESRDVIDAVLLTIVVRGVVKGVVIREEMATLVPLKSTTYLLMYCRE